ncbi:MAG: RDD family protein [Pseudomonadota bacterium]|nr:RDD family protein [Pseudomonadota bacterium]
MAPYFRRVAAGFYDALLLIAIFFIAALPLPLIESSVRDTWWTQLIVQCLLVTLSFYFFGWFWTRNSQTLGMRAWRLVIQQNDGNRVTWRSAVIRFSVALLSWLPAALLACWVLIETSAVDSGNYPMLLLVVGLAAPAGLAFRWHDRCSRTRLIVIERQNTRR